MATKQLILTENIPGLGAEADIVTVRAGYARNYLLPKRMACEVTPSALRRINLLKAKRAEREAKELADAEELARRIKKITLTFTLETGETGKAFGSVTSQDIADRLKAELGGGTVIDRHKLELERPIKEHGEFEIPLKIHPDVTASVRLVVKTSAPQEESSGEGDGSAQTAKDQADKKTKARRAKA